MLCIPDIITQNLVLPVYSGSSSWLVVFCPLRNWLVFSHDTRILHNSDFNYQASQISSLIQMLWHIWTEYKACVNIMSQYLTGWWWIAWLCFTGSWSCHLCLALLKDKASIYQQNQNSTPEWYRKSVTRPPQTHTYTHTTKWRRQISWLKALPRCSWVRLQLSSNSLNIYSGGSNCHYQPACEVPVYRHTHTLLDFCLHRGGLANNVHSFILKGILWTVS